MRFPASIVQAGAMLLLGAGCTCTHHRDIYFSASEERSSAGLLADRAAMLAGFKEAGADENTQRFQNGDIGFLYDRKADAVVVHSTHCGLTGIEEWKSRSEGQSKLVRRSFNDLGQPLEKLEL